MLTCSFFVFQEIFPEGGGALFPWVIWMPVEGRVGCLHHLGENVENPQVLKCNFLKLSSLAQ